MARRTILAVPIPADVEDVLQILSDVARGWAAAKVETDGSMLTVTASRRRAQRPAPDEEPDEDYAPPQLVMPGSVPVPGIDISGWTALDPQPYAADANPLPDDDESLAFAAGLAQ